MSQSQPQEEDKQLEPFKEQEPFLYDDKRYYGYISGVGSGKTAVGVMRDALNMEVWNPGYMGAIVAPTTQMIKNAILPLMKDFGLMERWEYKGPQAEMPGIQSPNGSRAVILSADNERQVERLASLNLAWWHIDESRDVPPRAKQILIQRLRKGDYTNGYVTSTPRGQNHDYDFFVGDVDTEQRTHGEATIYEADDRLAITAVSTDANPHLDRDDVQAIRDAHPSGILEQEVEGQFVEIGSGIFTTDMLHFAELEDIQDKPYDWVIGVDVGVEADSKKANQNDSDYWVACLLMVDRRHNTAYVVDVLRERGLTLKQGIGWISGVADLGENRPKPKVFIESNQAQRWLFQELSDHGLNANAVMNTSNKEDRLIQMSIPIERGDVQFLNQVTDESPDEIKKRHEQLGYDPRFQPIVNELLSFPNGSHDDAIDALEIAVDNTDFGGGKSILGANPYGGGSDDSEDTWMGMQRK